MQEKEVCITCAKVRETHMWVWKDWRTPERGFDTSDYHLVQCATCSKAAKERRTRVMELTEA